MASLPSTDQTANWKRYELIAFRLAFIYFFIQAFPLDWKYYRNLFTAPWSSAPAQSLLGLTTYAPQFFSSGSISPGGLSGFANWGIVLSIAAVGTVLWSALDKNKKEYNGLYYWLRVLLRYRLSIAVISFGIIKLFPLQMPAPSLSDLHTPYGDFLPWKVYSLTTGVASAHYESTLGLIEILGGVLLLFRKTTTIGAGLITAFLINVVIANFAYELGAAVYSAYLLVIALFLLLYDARRLFQLLVLRRLARANRFQPSFDGWNFRGSRIVLRTAFVVFVLFFGFTIYAGYSAGNTAFPHTAAIPDVTGYYNVRSFRLNGEERPYSLSDTIRWQDVVFEKWNTISIRSARRFPPDLAEPALLPGSIDPVNSYEVTGNGGRAFFTYTPDTVQQVLHLHNKHPLYAKEQWVLHYSKPAPGTILLKGTNEAKDSVEVVLERVEKKYLLYEGRRKPIRIY